MNIFQGFTGALCESTLTTTTLATTALVTTTTSVVLCPNQNTCQNQGVCYLIGGVTRCVCPQGNLKNHSFVWMNNINI